MTAQPALSAPPSAELRFTDDGRKIYEPDGAMLVGCLTDRAPVSGIRGPIGSGKSLMNFNKLWQIACEQQRSSMDGMRKTRWGVVRNTFPDLEGSTVKDWIEWFPEDQYGRLYRSRPLEHHMECGDVRCEVVFMALDRDEDIRKLRSTQFTGFLWPELQFTHKAIWDEAHGRTGRYPSMAEGGATWHGMLFDMNEPGEDHWLLQMTGEVEFPEDMPPDERARLRWPPDWKYYVQPPALIEVANPDGKTIRGYKINPLAENTRWLKPGYYSNLVRGKDKRWIDSRLMNRISVWVDGRPVWPQFREETHVARAPLKAQYGYPILVGLDFGRSPAAVFCQLVNSRWYFLDELVAFNVDSTSFAPMVKRKLDTRFPGFDVHLYGDPKGRDGQQAGTLTSYDVFEGFGLRVDPAPFGDKRENDIQVRVEAVGYALNSMHDGAPRVLLDPTHCRALKVAMAGKYHYRLIKGTGRYEEKPFKDQYSNIADACQYVMLSEGEGRVMVGRPAQGNRQPVQAWKGRRSLRRAC